MTKFKSFALLLIVAFAGTACTAFLANEPAPTEMSSAATMVPASAATLPKIEATSPPQLPVIGPAPEWQNDTWINTKTPLRLADLRGKVILLEFWTFG